MSDLGDDLLGDYEMDELGDRATSRPENKTVYTAPEKELTRLRTIDRRECEYVEGLQAKLARVESMISVFKTGDDSFGINSVEAESLLCDIRAALDGGDS